MKIPQHPPNWLATFNGAPGNFERFMHVLKLAPGSTYGSRYIHWDKLRRLKPPGDLTHAEWWAALKAGRAALLKPLPLRDVDGKPFQYALPDPAIELLHELDKNAAGQILVSDEVTNPEERDRYVIHSLMEEAITSSQIEGAATTRLVAKEMLRTGRKPRNRDEQMIANNYAAMQRIRAIKDNPLSPEVILELHRILAEAALDDDSGVARFRRVDERVVVQDAYNEVLHTPPPAGQLDDRIRAMCDFANGATPDHFLHPVVRAITLHFWLAFDHPFVDGNGRCARALFYWSMLRSGYWLTEFISISQLIRRAQVRYGRAFLYSETDGNDMTYFILYHLELIRRAIDELRTYLREKMAEVREAEKLLRNSDNFNYRQLALLSHALRHPDMGYSIASHQASHGVVYETARTDLLGLEHAGLLESKKRGKTYFFYPVIDLRGRMRKGMAR